MPSAITTQTRVVDRGLNRIVRQFDNVNGAKVKVGWPEGSGATDEGTLIAEYMSYNEFGTATIPARPVLGDSAEKNSEKYDRIIQAGTESATDGRSGFVQMLTRLGVEARNDVVREFTEGNFAPNAPATIERKGSSRPLIDTGISRASVQFKVEI